MTVSVERWYRLPIAWLGVAVFIASLAGCIGVIVLASRYADEPLPVEGERLLKVPATLAGHYAPATTQ
jgi:branched-subunit amino acid permease